MQIHIQGIYGLVVVRSYGLILEWQVIYLNITAVPGKVIAVEVSQGQVVKAGDTVVILESMKMEIPVVVPQDGTIASIAVSQGNEVENGAVLATMN